MKYEGDDFICSYWNVWNGPKSIAGRLELFDIRGKINAIQIIKITQNIEKHDILRFAAT